MITTPFVIFGFPGAGFTNAATLRDWRPAAQEYEAAVRAYGDVVKHPDALGAYAAVAIDSAEADLREAVQRHALEGRETELHRERPGKLVRPGYRVRSAFRRLMGRGAAP